MSNERLVKNESYINIQGFMVNELGLKGNELLIYAIIYGFSQDENSNFTGSLKYLMEWTNASKPTVIDTLEKLVAKSLIIKEVYEINKIKFCKYRVNLDFFTNKETLPEVKKFNQGGKETLLGELKNLTGGGKETLPNNINNTIDNTIEDNLNIYKEIIEYLNLKAGTNYKSSTDKTKKSINARLKEGYVLEDFKVVIDKKCLEWLDTEMEKYLCPDTLFGTKFEKYLNQNILKSGNKEITKNISGKLKVDDNVLEQLKARYGTND
ncbi:conserved phage C-terminal domain-containing protein [Fusobacterium nucleatum]|uniref:Phage conserved hypothetical protein C-terminal domain-containing protein n=1 Tax=Podoviridae sp. ct8nN1 TaxID=2827296 RepID=A0A8S5R379_9CAUD|nr:MAG TPA: hypothetical protein [Podoviridae sp. ct8nN1]